jgi:hypothetical protein
MNDDEVAPAVKQIWDGLGQVFAMGISKLTPGAATLICKGIESRDLEAEFRVGDGLLTCTIKRGEEIVYQFSVETAPQAFHWTEVPTAAPVN